MDIINRVKNICLAPNSEWPVIAEESTTTGELITGYVAPLAAIGAVAGFIGGSLVGHSLPFVGFYRVPIMAGLGMAAFTFVMAIVGAFVLGMLLTPPDVISQTLLAIPVWLLFEAGVFFSGWFIHQKQQTTDEAAAAGDYEPLSEAEMDAELDRIDAGEKD